MNLRRVDRARVVSELAPRTERPAASASSHKWEAYRRRRFGRFSRRERRAYFDPYVRSEQRRKSAQSTIGPPNGFAVTPRRSRGSVTLPAYHAPESRASIASESSRVL